MSELKAPKFKAGDPIRSAQGSSDIEQMEMIWKGVVHLCRPAPAANTPDDHVYTTVGFWYNLDGRKHDKTKKPKSRQLWANHLELDV